MPWSQTEAPLRRSSGRPFQVLPPGSPGRAMVWKRQSSRPVAMSMPMIYPPPGAPEAVTPWITLFPTIRGALRSWKSGRLVAGALSSIFWSQALAPVLASSAITCRSEVETNTRPPPKARPIFWLDGTVDG